MLVPGYPRIVGSKEKISATGGQVVRTDEYVTHTFLDVGSSSFEVVSGSGEIDYLVVGGGGGGNSHVLFGCCGFDQSAGGRGGQVEFGKLFITTGAYATTVGSGGAGAGVIGGDGAFVCDRFSASGAAGTSSSFSDFLAAGGGGGGGSGQIGVFVPFMNSHYGGNGGSSSPQPGGGGASGNGALCDTCESGIPGTNGTGGGGGGMGGQNSRCGGSRGGSGTVVIRYKA